MLVKTKDNLKLKRRSSPHENKATNDVLNELKRRAMSQGAPLGLYEGLRILQIAHDTHVITDQELLIKACMEAEEHCDMSKTSFKRGINFIIRQKITFGK